MDNFFQHKRNIEQKIADTILSNLENENITRSEASSISNFVLDKIDVLKTQEELLNFLRELSARWRIFSSLLVLESGEIKEIMDTKAAREALTLTKEGKIEDALNVARAATSNSVNV